MQPPLVNSFGFATGVGKFADKRAAAFDQRRNRQRPSTALTGIRQNGGQLFDKERKNGGRGKD
jgi:hypothetical protein